MKTATRLAIAAALWSGGSLAIAQDEAPEEGKRPRPDRPPNPLVAALDADKDKEISADEIANASEALKTLDKNADGKLTREELRPGRPKKDGDADAEADADTDAGEEKKDKEKQRPRGGEGHRPPPPLIKALDADGDHEISADEIAGAPAALKALDKDNDGRLTHDELRPERPEKGPRADGMPPKGSQPPPPGGGPAGPRPPRQ